MCPMTRILLCVTVLNEMVHTMPLVVLVGTIPPGTEGRSQGRSRLAPLAWPSHSYLDEEFVGSWMPTIKSFRENAHGPAFDVRSLI